MYDQEQLNPQQRRAVEYGDGPLLILAGAGTGKTRVLVHRIARLLQRGVPPWQILAVTFSNKAAGEMRQRLQGLLGSAADRMWIGTFHGTCARLLRMHGEQIGLRRDFTIFDDDDQKRVINALLKEHGLDESITTQSMRILIDRKKSHGMAQQSADRAVDDMPGPAEEICRQIYPLYQQRLAAEGAVDFNDLLLKVIELAEHPEVSDILGSQFRHVLVDEFQDTNRVQYRLVRHFSRASRNLTVVGDDDQSIYSWRGAEPKNLLDFDRDYQDAGIIKLEHNYRSTQVILDAANGVIAKNRNRHEKALFTDRKSGEPVLLEQCPDERAEADFIARAILGLSKEENRGLGDLAVLYRTHAQSRALEEQLRRHDIHYRISGGVSFFQRKEIKDILAYVRLVMNSSADLCFERIINVPARGIGKTTVDRLQGYARAQGLSCLEATRKCVRGEVAAITGAARKRLQTFVDIIDGLRDVEAAGASVAEMIIQTAERSGYRSTLEAEGTVEAQERLENLSELVSMASDFDEESGGKGTMLDFDERISLASANDSADGRATGSVTLMTIHAAKGLEFPVVFLCGMEDGLFPSLRPRDGADPNDALEEERRLAYVAMTRAMERLIITYARTRRQWGEIRINPPSRFIDEIPTECLAVRARPEPPPMHVSGRGGRMSGAMRGPSRAGRGFGRGGYDEFDQRPHYDDEVPTYYADEAPSYEDDAGGIRVGGMVSHEIFGLGRVVQASGRGKDRKLRVLFASAGEKTVLARFVEPA